MPEFLIGLLLNIGVTPTYEPSYDYQVAVVAEYFKSHPKAHAQYMGMCKDIHAYRAMSNTDHEFCTWYRDYTKLIKARQPVSTY